MSRAGAGLLRRGDSDRRTTPTTPARGETAPGHPDPETLDGRHGWSWAFDTENGAEAGAIALARGAAAELADLAIDCAPAVRVTVDVGHDHAAPDLSEVR